MNGKISVEDELNRMKYELETLRADLNQLGLQENVLFLAELLETSQQLDSKIVEYMDLKNKLNSVSRSV